MEEKHSEFINSDEYKYYKNGIESAMGIIGAIKTFGQIADEVSELKRTVCQIEKAISMGITTEVFDACVIKSDVIKKTMCDVVPQDVFIPVQDLIKNFGENLLKSFDINNEISSVIYSLSQFLLQSIKDIDLSQFIDNALEEEFDNSEEFEQAFIEQIENPIGFQERFANWVDEKKRKYFIYCLIIFHLWTIFFQPYLQDKIGRPVMARIESTVKELPEKKSKVVCHIGQGTEMIITENVNYYYKVSFVNENGVAYEGYVAKRNIELLRETDDKEDTEVEENKTKNAK